MDEAKTDANCPLWPFNRTEIYRLIDERQINARAKGLGV
jgi:hypothetical protein